MDDGHVLLLDRGIEEIARDGLHHDQGVGVAIELEEGQDAVEQRGDVDAIRAQNARS